MEMGAVNRRAQVPVARPPLRAGANQRSFWASRRFTPTRNSAPPLAWDLPSVS